MRKLSEVFSPRIDLTTDFRVAANLGIACAVFLLGTPFTINNFVQGRYPLGVATALVELILGFNTWSILRGRFRPMLIFATLVPAVILALSLMIHKQQIIGVLWSYSGIFAFYFMLKERHAWVANMLLLLFILPFAWAALDSSLAIRATITLILISAFTAVFVRLISYQQSKLREAKENAEAANRAKSIVLADMKQVEEDLLLKTHQLGERIKELNCLYGISKITEERDMPLEDTLQAIVGLIPPAWQYPEVTCARIIFDGRELKSDNFVESRVVASQCADIMVRGDVVGIVEVGYLEERGESEEGPFLKDERRLIDEIAERLGTIVERVRAEETLRESEHLMRLIADNTPACISYVGIDDLRYRFVNRRHEETAGMSQGEMLGKHIREVIGESNYQFALKYMEEVKAGKSTSYVNEFDLAEGKRWIQVNYVPDIDEFGKVRAVVVSSYDITDMKLAEEALRKSEHQMRLIADNSPAYIAYVGSEDLRYHFVNQKFESGFGIPREEIVGMHIREVIGESNYQFALNYIDEVKSGVPASYINTFNLGHEKRWVEVNYIPDFDEHGGVKGIVVFSYDVTETKSAEERYRESERRLSEIINFLPDPTFAIDANGRGHHMEQCH